MAGNGPLTGKVFNGRYELGERIGVGGMAEVYTAQDLVLGRIVAVKTMLPQYSADPEFTRRFRQEAAAAANLQSPYIVNVYDWGHDDNTYYIVMEYVRGSDLKTAIVERGAINQRKVAEIGSQVCQALSAAHQQDIIHRDIKPQNIMIQPDGNIKVMDFGIARAKNSTADKTEVVLGTAHYTSPEQAQGKELSPASDIYSLGIVLYEAATGTLPFDGPDAVSVALMQVQQQPLDARQVNPDIDPTFDAIIMTAMQKDPAQRFATASDMRKALNEYLAGRPVNIPALTAAGIAAGIGAGAAIGAATTQVIGGTSSDRTTVMRPVPGQGATPIIDGTQVMPHVGGAGGPGRGGQPPQRRYSGNEPQPPQKKGKGPIIAAVIAAVVIIGLAVVFFFGNMGEMTDVPDVVGMNTEDAVEVIEEAGFTVGRVEERESDTEELDTVLDQNPRGGSQAPKGSAINLVVSSSSGTREVPDVTGKTQAEAKTALTVAGFKLGIVTEEASDTVEEGKVISQDPLAGSNAEKNTTVNIVISKGKEQVDVPSLVGKSANEAGSICASLGLNFNVSDRQYSSSVPEGQIISQNPSGGKISKGSTINCVVSLGQDNNAPIPSVTGSSEASARSAIENAGFSVEVTYNFSSTVPKGNVISQNPTGTAKKGSTVTLVVSLGPTGDE